MIDDVLYSSFSIPGYADQLAFLVAIASPLPTAEDPENELEDTDGDLEDKIEEDCESTVCVSM